LRNAPHTAIELAGEWEHSYDRMAAAFPGGPAAKYWPPVKRIDGAYGDRNLVCSCPDPEALEECSRAALDTTSRPAPRHAGTRLLAGNDASRLTRLSSTKEAPWVRKSAPPHSAVRTARPTGTRSCSPSTCSRTCSSRVASTSPGRRWGSRSS